MFDSENKPLGSLYFNQLPFVGFISQFDRCVISVTSYLALMILFEINDFKIRYAETINQCLSASRFVLLKLLAIILILIEFFQHMLTSFLYLG
jgi:hypothetical protein